MKSDRVTQVRAGRCATLVPANTGQWNGAGSRTLDSSDRILLSSNVHVHVVGGLHGDTRGSGARSSSPGAPLSKTGTMNHDDRDTCKWV